jgi:hypothetical protein
MKNGQRPYEIKKQCRGKIKRKLNLIVYEKPLKD